MIAKVTAWAKRHPIWSTLIAALVILAVVSPFVLPGTPNLDENVAGDSASSIRERIAGHRDWDEKLSNEQLDQLAAFIASNAGRREDRGAVSDHGLTLWRDNDCGSCHTLAAGESGGR